jgi:hypothetical protein
LRVLVGTLTLLLAPTLAARSSGCEARINVWGDDLLATRANVVDVIRRVGFAESS